MPGESWIAPALRGYRRVWLRNDLVAALVLAALLVPEGLAYAELAGLPPVTGLYTTVLALGAYAALGPSRTLVLGPDSALSPMIAAVIVPLLGPHDSPAQAVALAGMLALLIGALCVIAGLARAGVVAELMSRPVRVGLLAGIAIVVIVGQLPKLFGFSGESGTLTEEMRAFVDGLLDGDTNAAALAIGLGCLAVIIGCRRWLPRVPGILVAVAGATIVVGVLGLADEGVAVVGHYPSGFPAPSIPRPGTEQLGRLAVAAFGLAFVTLADSTALSRAFALEAGEDVDPDREMVALGVANLAAGLFQGFGVSASASRTAVGRTSGARTPLAGLLAAAVIVVLLAPAEGLVRNLPQSALAAVIVTAVLTLVDLDALTWLWRVRRSEFVLAIIAFLGVTFVGVLQGIGIAVVLSIGNFIRHAWRPYDAVLGQLPDQRGFHDVDRHDGTEQIPGLVLYRFDAPLFFANAELFTRRVRELVARSPVPVRWVVVVAEPITDIDTSAADALRRLLDELDAERVQLVFARLHGPVKDRLRSYGLYDRIGDDHYFPTLGTAVEAYRSEHPS